nr:LINE-type retrotransposon LIb DNA [Ipomoea batatas]
MKGSAKRPEKARGKPTGEVKEKSTRTPNAHKVTQADSRTGGASGAVRAAGNSAQQVHTATNLRGKGNQVDVIPVSNTFSYLQDLESLPEAPVLFEEETAPRSAPKSKNQRRNNKGNKQPSPALEPTRGRAGLPPEGGPAPNQLFVFGNPTGAHMSTDGMPSGNEASSSKSFTQSTRIKGIQESAFFPSSRGLQVLENKLIYELNQVLQEEEILWFQKSRRLWIQDGDRNTSFYHKSTLIRRNRARIRMLKIDGEWNADLKVISDHLSNFFIDLFDRRDPDHGITNVIYVGPKINHAQKVALSRLQAILPRDEVNKIRSIPIPLDDLVPDALYWPTSPGGMFSVQEAYRYIAGGDSTEEVDWVWKVKTAERCRMFLWLAVKNKLLTNAVRARRQLTDEDGCTACGEFCESIDHILMHCDVARTCWRKTHTPTSFTLGAASSFIQWLKLNCSSTEMMNDVPWSLIFTYTCWELWKARNKRIFEHVNPSPQEITRRAKFTARETFISGHQRKPERMENMRWACSDIRFPRKIKLVSRVMGNLPTWFEEH